MVKKAKRARRDSLTRGQQMIDAEADVSGSDDPEDEEPEEQHDEAVPGLIATDEDEEDAPTQLHPRVLDNAREAAAHDAWEHNVESNQGFLRRAQKGKKARRGGVETPDLDFERELAIEKELQEEDRHMRNDPAVREPHSLSSVSFELSEPLTQFYDLFVNDAFVHSNLGSTPDEVERRAVLILRALDEKWSEIHASPENLQRIREFFRLEQGMASYNIADVKERFLGGLVQLRLLTTSRRAEHREQNIHSLDMLHTCFLTSLDIIAGFDRLELALSGTAFEVDSLAALPKKKLAKATQIISFLLGEISKRGFRREGEWCYRQMKVGLYKTRDGTFFFRAESVEDDLPGTRPRTFSEELGLGTTLHGEFGLTSWRAAMTIVEFVHHSGNKEFNVTQRNQIGTQDRLYANWLQDCTDPEFRNLQPLRDFRSFRNGVLSVARPKGAFFAFGVPGLRIPSYVTSCNDYNIAFDESLVFYDTTSSTVHKSAQYWWMNIPTPHFDKILNSQHLRPFVKGTVWALIGRLMYWLNVYDDWQVIMFVLGLGGTGKSRICQVIQKLFHKRYVRDLSANMEEKFGLSALEGGWLYVCQEVTRYFRLPESDLTQLIDGVRGMNIATKYETASMKAMRQPGAFFGNELGPWSNKGLRVSRRLILILFPWLVDKACNDPDLEKELEQEMAHIIFKARSAYDAFLHQSVGRSIWNSIPSYFTDARDRMAMRMNPVCNFICDSDFIEFDNSNFGKATLSITWPRFMELLRVFLGRSENSKDIAAKDVEDVLETFGLKVEKPRLNQDETKQRPLPSQGPAPGAPPHLFSSSTVRSSTQRFIRGLAEKPDGDTEALRRQRLKEHEQAEIMESEEWEFVQGIPRPPLHPFAHHKRKTFV